MEIKGFREVTMMDWSGVMASVVFVGGCNFRCSYCHNHALAFAPDSLNSISKTEIFERIKCLKNWIDGVILSGGEPTLHGDELAAFLRGLKDEGFKTKLYTNGSMPDVIEKLLNNELLNAVSMDIKHMPDRYGEIVRGALPDLQDRIRLSVDMIKKSNIEAEFRTTIVKGIHSLDDIRAIREMAKPKALILQNVSESDIPEGDGDIILPFTATEFQELQKLNQ
jgi:pyruvate formate lyase activating enzyme